MNHTYHFKMRAALWAMLGIACVASTPTMAAEPAWWTQQKIACGLPSSLAYNNWDGKCNSSPRGSTYAPSYDDGAARRAQEAAAERQRQQAEADRIERERLAEEKRKKDEEFIRDRDATASTLKGSSGAAMSQLKGLSGADSSSLKGSGFDTGSTGLKELRGSDRTDREARSQPAPHTDASVVDARVPRDGAYLTNQVPELKRSPAADRITKGNWGQTPINPQAQSACGIHRTLQATCGIGAVWTDCAFNVPRSDRPLAQRGHHLDFGRD